LAKKEKEISAADGGRFLGGEAFIELKDCSRGKGFSGVEAHVM